MPLKEIKRTSDTDGVTTIESSEERNKYKKTLGVGVIGVGIPKDLSTLLPSSSSSLGVYTDEESTAFRMNTGAVFM